MTLVQELESIRNQQGRATAHPYDRIPCRETIVIAHRAYFADMVFSWMGEPFLVNRGYRPTLLPFADVCRLRHCPKITFTACEDTHRNRSARDSRARRLRDCARESRALRITVFLTECVKVIFGQRLTATHVRLSRVIGRTGRYQFKPLKPSLSSAR